LGDLGGGGVSSIATSISSDGSVVAGYSSSGLFSSEVFRWSGGNAVGLGFSTPTFTSYTRRTVIISANGGTVVSGQGLIWNAGSISSISGAPTWLETTAVSGDGNTIVGYRSQGVPLGFVEAFVSMAGTSSALNLGFSGGFSAAMAISDDGTVIAGHGGPSGSFGGFVYQGGNVTSFQPDGFVLGISGNGSSVVGATQAGMGVAFRWQNGSTISLGDLSGGPTRSDAYAVSLGGDRVVGVGYTVNGAEAFVWDEATGMESLADRLVGQGVDLSSEGWTRIVAAYDISDDGRFVVGYGIRNGVNEAFIADIGTSQVPEPSTYGALAVATLAIGRSILRRKRKSEVKAT
jgi:uncharacterized membrane protein